ncbi:oligoendopeptidase F [Atopobacter sp. AH10]|uniref:oligoendopeptidase F n=1 Tax=Atopobacter sp. AH10 TaxID=2315861 RepID=UPI000EF1A73B|nr:oligoendopeptidase F [Atopobacter sp. AH10]RLK63976.1 oligoendopeptidase F [Atopobacter sp. AH10]
MAEQLLERSQVDQSRTWDLSLLFKSQKDFQEAARIFEKDVISFEKHYKGQLTDDDSIISALKDYNQLLIQADWLGSYCYLAPTVDAYGKEAGQNLVFYEPIASAFSVRTSFFKNVLASLSKESMVKVKEVFPDAIYFIEQVKRFNPHRLSPEVEETLAQLNGDLFNHLDSYETSKFKDMVFDDFEVEGETYPNSYVLFENDYEMDLRTEVRRAAFDSFHKTLKKYRHSAADQYIRQVRLEKKLAHMRGFKSVFDYLLFDQQVTRKEYDRQLDVIMEELAPVMRRYVKILQQAHGLDKMTIKDVKVSLPSEASKVTIDDALVRLKDAFSILGEDYTAMIQRAFDERWIDFPMNLGKSTGGFCSSVYGGPSYVLLSWTGLMNELLVLAHELGHAGHFQNANANNAAIVPEVSLYCIEAPSTANEVIMCQYLLSHLSDPEEKRNLTAEFLSRTYFHNMVTHLLEAYYQREVYELVDKGAYIDADTLDSIFKKTLEKFWGPDVEISEGAELTWMRQPHYYMGLYSYTYSAGLTIGTQVGLKMVKDPQKYASKWLEVLKAGGRVTPYSFAAGVDVDITTDQALKDTIAYIGKLVDSLE